MPVSQIKNPPVSKPVDPYLEWAKLTQFRGFGEEDRLPSMLNFVVELTKAGSFGDIAASINDTATRKRIHVPEAYRNGLLRGLSLSFVTLRLKIEDTDLNGIISEIEKISTSPLIKSMQIGFQRGTDNRDYGKYIKSTGAGERKLLIGVIDDACAFAHHALLKDGCTRVLACWDQSTVGKINSDHELPNFNYGGHWTNDDFEKLIEDWADEESLYDHMENSPQQRPWSAPLTGRASHGAAVAGLAAGNSESAFNARRLRDGEPWSFSSSGQDAASQATIAFVQLPREQTGVVHSRWLNVNALDGIHYLLDLAFELANASPGHGVMSDGTTVDAGSPERPHPMWPLVINLSYGPQAGPHDGSGMLERAMDELCGQLDRFAIVLAAGNTGGTQRHPDNDFAYLPSGIHATCAAIKGHSAALKVLVPEDKGLDTYVELWFDRRLDDKTSVTVISPNGDRLIAQAGESKHLPTAETPTEVTAGLFFVIQPAQSDRKRSMALLALSQTRLDAGVPAAPAGVWEILISTTSDAPVSVEAWIERDDTRVGGRRGQAARFVDGWPIVNDTNTLNGVATGFNVFAAGAVRASFESPEAQPSPYTATGSQWDTGPEFSAVTDESVQRPGIWVDGNHSGTVVRANGTSMAAPQVTRWIANQFAEQCFAPCVRTEVALAAGQRTARVGKIIP